MKKNTLMTYLIITLGSIITASGIYFFKFPNNFSTGGVSSLSIILSKLAPRLTAGQYMIGANLILLCIGLAVFGKKFAFKTVYTSVLISVCTRLFEIFIPLQGSLTNQKMPELVFAVALTALGSAIIFNERASSGGTDIVAMILQKYTNLDIGKALLCSDLFLALAGVFIFNLETGMYSVLGLILKAFVVDYIIDGINLCKCFTIVTDKPDLIVNYINIKLHRGASVADCCGAFTDEQKKLIITVLKRNQAVALKRYVNVVDKSAFTIITNSSDVLGKGFRTVI